MKFTQLILAVFSLAVAGCATPPGNAAYPEQAEKTYRWTPNVDPNAARAYSSFLIGRYAALTNDPREAARRYAEAVAREPGDADLVERAVFAALLSGEMEAATYISKSAGTKSWPERFCHIAASACSTILLAVD